VQFLASEIVACEEVTLFETHSGAVTTLALACSKTGRHLAGISLPPVCIHGIIRAKFHTIPCVLDICIRATDAIVRLPPSQTPYLEYQLTVEKEKEPQRLPLDIMIQRKITSARSLTDLTWLTDEKEEIFELEAEAEDKTAFFLRIVMVSAWPPQVKAQFWLNYVEALGQDLGYQWALKNTAALAGIDTGQSRKVCNSTRIPSRIAEPVIIAELDRHRRERPGQDFHLMNKGAGSSQQQESIRSTLAALHAPTSDMKWWDVDLFAAAGMLQICPTKRVFEHEGRCQLVLATTGLFRGQGDVIARNVALMLEDLCVNGCALFVDDWANLNNMLLVYRYLKILRSNHG
jgi:hypothetical protein